MGSFPLEGKRIVLTGDLSPYDAEDAKWMLIEKGASVMASVTKTTALVIAGPNPTARIIKGAEKHGVTVAEPKILEQLATGATMDQALSGSSDENPTPLSDLTVVISGRLPGSSKSEVRAELERLGANVVNKPSSKTDLLVVGNDPSNDGLDAMDDGVPFIELEEVRALASGTPLSRYIGSRSLEDDPNEVVPTILEGLRSEMTSIEEGGEVWDDELVVTLRPGGRISAVLNHLGGTPVEDHIRRIIQRTDWPRVSSPHEHRMTLKINGC